MPTKVPVTALPGAADLDAVERKAVIASPLIVLPPLPAQDEPEELPAPDPSISISTTASSPDGDVLGLAPAPSSRRS